MRKILIFACLAVIVLAPFLVSGALSSPNLDMNKKSALAGAGSIALSYAPSITVMAEDLGKAASGNSNPVNLTVNVTELSSSSSIFFLRSRLIMNASGSLLHRFVYANDFYFR